MTLAIRRENKSFTLTELILVAVMVSLLAALVVPAIGGAARGLAGRSAAYDLVRLLREARWRSAQTARTCLVKLIPTEGGYRAEALETTPGRPGPEAIQADWARSELLEDVGTLMKIPPDRGGSSRRELTIRFEPWGVGADYVVALQTGDPMRIEVRRPSGLVWLVPAEKPSPFDRESFLAIENYWRDWCRDPRR